MSRMLGIAKCIKFIYRILDSQYDVGGSRCPRSLILAVIIDKILVEEDKP